MFRRLFASALIAPALLAAAALLAPAAKAEPLDLTLSYQLSLSQPIPAITNILTFNHTVNGGGAWWAAEVPAGETSWIIGDPFQKRSADAPLDGLMLGLVQDLPFDVIDPALDALNVFTEGDATNGILGPGGVALTSWFALAAPVLGHTVTSTFTVMAFSDGQAMARGRA